MATTIERAYALKDKMHELAQAMPMTGIVFFINEFLPFLLVGQLIAAGSIYSSLEISLVGLLLVKFHGDSLVFELSLSTGYTFHSLQCVFNVGSTVAAFHTGYIKCLFHGRLFF